MLADNHYVMHNNQ